MILSSILNMFKNTPKISMVHIILFYNIEAELALSTLCTRLLAIISFQIFLFFLLIQTPNETNVFIQAENEIERQCPDRTARQPLFINVQR
jgi:hypothetical protein